MTLRKLINLFTEATNTANAGTAAGYKGSAGAQAIAQSSGIKDVNKIAVGQNINLPGGGSYQVKKGDTLDKIARNNPAPPAAPAVVPGPPAQNKPDADAAAKQNIFAPPAPAPAVAAPVTDPKPAVDPAIASGQNIGGQFAKAASDKAAQDSFAQLTGMAPKVAPASAAPTQPAPAPTATTAPAAGTTAALDQAKSGLAAGAPAPAEPFQSSGTTTTTIGGQIVPPNAVKDRFGEPMRSGSGEFVTSREFEEDVNDEDKLAEMLRLSGIPLNEKAVSKQQQKFMGMVHAMQKGKKIKGASSELKKAAKGMSKKAAHDYAATKHKGLPKRVSESVMLEAGNTLEHIVQRFKHETKNFLNGAELDDDLYNALYDYYVDNGEMPYGVAKAREGDPYQWVGDHFEDALAMMGHQRVFQETVMPVMDDSLSELARLAGLSESRVDECGDMMGGEESSMNVSTNMSSDGKKSVTISAQGEEAESLIQMLKLAGMGHHGHDSHSEEPVVMISSDDEMMDEEYANSPEEEYETVDAITRQGNDLNREKRQYADKPKLGDNPMAEEIALDEELEALLNSVLIQDDEQKTGKQEEPSRVKGTIAPAGSSVSATFPPPGSGQGAKPSVEIKPKEQQTKEGSIRGGDRPGELTGTWSADPPEKGKPNVPPPVPMDPVSPAAPKTPSSPAMPRPGVKK